MGGLGGFGCKNQSQRLSYIYVLSGGGDPPNPLPPPLVLIFCMTIYTGSGNCQGEIGWGGSLPREFMIRACRAR